MINISKEVKLKIKDKNQIIKKLKSKNAVLIGGCKETSTRYDDKEGSYEKKGEFIRLRSGLKNTITLKEKVDKEDSKILTRNDIEIEVDNLKGIKYILKKLGLNPIYTMEKYRLKWLYNENEIDIDELLFGCFLEIHGKEDEIWKILEELELKKEDIIEGTYWDIFEEFKKTNEKYKNETNIKFPEGYSYKLAE